MIQYYIRPIYIPKLHTSFEVCEAPIGTYTFKHYTKESTMLKQLRKDAVVAKKELDLLIDEIGQRLSEVTKK